MKASELLNQMVAEMGTNTEASVAVDVLVMLLRHVRRSGHDVIEVDMDEDALFDFYKKMVKSD